MNIETNSVFPFNSFPKGTEINTIELSAAWLPNGCIYIGPRLTVKAKTKLMQKIRPLIGKPGRINVDRLLWLAWRAK